MPKLSEALLDRAELQKKTVDLQNRLKENAVIQQDDVPAENPKELFDDLISTYSKLDELNKRINLTNNTTEFNSNNKLSDVLAKRESLDKQIKELTNLASCFALKNNRYSKTEIKMVATMDIKIIRSHIELLQKYRKELDRKIQALNWSVELLS